MKPRKKVAILGGGPAGLCTHFIGRNLDVERVLFEASDSLGGNCSTLDIGGYRFDTGAHRLHDKDKEVTDLAKHLLGQELQQVSAPSQICWDGHYTDFPLSPLNLLTSMGWRDFTRACIQVILSRLKPVDTSNFESFAIHQYGELVARRFLLEYSEKLWGVPTSDLSPMVAGSRLKGLDLKTFLVESLRGRLRKTEHLDGAFYYPKKGIGQLFDCIGEELPSNELKLSARVTKIHHDGTRVHSVTINDVEDYVVDEVVSSLPLGILVKSLHPPAPEHVLEAVSEIKFRDVLLIMFCLDIESVNGNASMYFPSKEDPFTRIYEPRNRSKWMAPEGKTSLAVEVPMDPAASKAKNTDGFIDEVERKLTGYGFFKRSDVIRRHTYMLKNAYPVLTVDHQHHAEIALSFLKNLNNLYITGRNGLVQYSHIHDHMRNAMIWLETREL